MKRAGVVDLPLHGGSAPYWLVKRMKGLAHAILELLVEEYGVGGVVEKLADPLWFQSLSCVLAYDWHSSGTTTVVCGVLKSVIDPEEFGIGIAGGKGKASRNTTSEIEEIGLKLSLSDAKIEELKYASRISAKVDNACIQDGYQLYHHSMIITEKGEWAVIQQGMNPGNRYARRYHWLSSAVKSYEEPHQGIVGFPHSHVLDMTARDSRECREVSIDLVKSNSRDLKRLYKELESSFRIKKGQRTLLNFNAPTVEEEVPVPAPAPTPGQTKTSIFKLPRRVNWDALRIAYENQPSDFEQLLCIRGLGPATVRALALIAELIYGAKPSWQDPVKFSFAFGGKDGVPYPVDRHTMDETTEILQAVMKEKGKECKSFIH